MRRRSKDNISQRKTILRGLFFLNAILWFVYCVFIYYDMAIVNNNGTAADIATIFLFLMTIFMAASGSLLNRRPSLIYYPALLLVILNAIFTVMNLSNLLYLAAFVIDIISISLLLDLRKEYFPLS